MTTTFEPGCRCHCRCHLYCVVSRTIHLNTELARCVRLVVLMCSVSHSIPCAQHLGNHAVSLAHLNEGIDTLVDLVERVSSRELHYTHTHTHIHKRTCNQ